MNPATRLANDSEDVIGVVHAMVNLAINIVHVNFDEELLTNDEGLRMMKQQHHIDMMIFGERNSFESENQVKENMFAAT